MRLTKIVPALAILSLTASAPPSLSCLPGAVCTCVSGQESTPRFVHEFAAGAFDTTALRRGVFFEAAVVRAVYVDSLDRPVPRRAFWNHVRLARDFAVVRSWSRPMSVAVPDTVRLYVPDASACPLPAWQVGRRYLVFAYPVADTLRALTPCATIHPSDSSDTQLGFRSLDSLLVRRDH